MLFQVRIENDCYVVDGYFTVGKETQPVWHPLRKFAYQGDAIAFKNWDCPEVGWGMLEKLARRYDSKVIYERLDKNRFIRHRP